MPNHTQLREAVYFALGQGTAFHGTAMIITDSGSNLWGMRGIL